MSKIEKALKGQPVLWNAGEQRLAHRMLQGAATYTALCADAAASGVAFEKNVLFTMLDVGGHLQQRPDRYALKSDAATYWRTHVGGKVATVQAAGAPKLTPKPAAPPTSRSAPDGGLAAHTEKCLANPHMRAQAGLSPVATPVAPPGPSIDTAAIYARRRDEAKARRG